MSAFMAAQRTRLEILEEQGPYPKPKGFPSSCPNIAHTIHHQIRWLSVGECVCQKAQKLNGISSI